MAQAGGSYGYNQAQYHQSTPTSYDGYQQDWGYDDYGEYNSNPYEQGGRLQSRGGQHPHQSQPAFQQEYAHRPLPPRRAANGAPPPRHPPDWPQARPRMDNHHTPQDNHAQVAPPQQTYGNSYAPQSFVQSNGSINGYGHGPARPYGQPMSPPVRPEQNVYGGPSTQQYPRQNGNSSSDINPPSRPYAQPMSTSSQQRQPVPAAPPSQPSQQYDDRAIGYNNGPARPYAHQMSAPLKLEQSLPASPSAYAQRPPPSTRVQNIRREGLDPPSPHQQSWDNPFPAFHAAKRQPERHSEDANANYGPVQHQSGTQRPSTAQDHRSPLPMDASFNFGWEHNAAHHQPQGPETSQSSTGYSGHVENAAARRGYRGQATGPPVAEHNLHEPTQVSGYYGGGQSFSLPERPGTAPASALQASRDPRQDITVETDVRPYAHHPQQQRHEVYGDEEIPNFGSAPEMEGQGRRKDRGLTLHANAPQSLHPEEQKFEMPASAPNQPINSRTGYDNDGPRPRYSHDQPQRPPHLHRNDSNNTYYSDPGFAAQSGRPPMGRAGPPRLNGSGDPNSQFGPRGPPRDPRMRMDPRGGPPPGGRGHPHSDRRRGGPPLGAPREVGEGRRPPGGPSGPAGPGGSSRNTDPRSKSRGPQNSRGPIGAGIVVSGSAVASEASVGPSGKSNEPNGPLQADRMPPNGPDMRSNSDPRRPGTSAGGASVSPNPPTPLQTQNTPKSPSEETAKSPDALPFHPTPVRPGLLQNGNAAAKPTGNDRPPPVRQYDSQSGQSGPAPATQLPVTHEELNRLRERVRNSPQDQEAQFSLAKKLIEASTVLASDNGRADAKTTAKNRERYVLESHKLLKKLASGEHAEAQFYLADSLGTGVLGLDNDPKEAFQLYQSAAKNRHPQAAYRTAVCCEIGPEEGGGTRKDPVKAVQWYKRAASLGDVGGMYKTGMILIDGLLGAERNPGEGVGWLHRAAEKSDADHPHALHKLGQIYENPAMLGQGGALQKDDVRSFQMFTQAAKLGYKFSQFRLGQAYEYGMLGAPIDSRQSIIWYTKAAAQAEHQAELALSGWYLTGAEGILEHSDTEAYLWARKAATSDPPLPKALFALGYYTEVGIGCPRSLEEAKKWYGRAAAYKFPKAQERLEELRRGGARAQKNREKLSRNNQRQAEESCTVM